MIKVILKVIAYIIFPKLVQKWVTGNNAIKRVSKSEDLPWRGLAKCRKKVIAQKFS